MIKTVSLVIALIFAVLITAFPVNAQEGNRAVYSSNSKEKKKIALTFDDGPHPKNTPKIISILEENDVKATFFVIGVNAKNYPEALKLVSEKGHEIGNHTYSHGIIRGKSLKSIAREVIEAEEEIKGLTGVSTNLLRPPCGLYDDTTVSFAQENGYKIVLWNIDTLDWEHSSVSDIISTVTGGVKGGDIILFHDYISGENNTFEALKQIIPILKNKGYEFVTVSELLQNL